MCFGAGAEFHRGCSRVVLGRRGAEDELRSAASVEHRNVSEDYHLLDGVVDVCCHFVEVFAVDDDPVDDGGQFGDDLGVLGDVDVLGEVLPPRYRGDSGCCQLVEDLLHLQSRW